MAIAPLFLIGLLNALYLSVITNSTLATANCTTNLYCVYNAYYFDISRHWSHTVFLPSGMNDDCLINRNS